MAVGAVLLLEHLEASSNCSPPKLQLGSQHHHQGSRCCHHSPVFHNWRPSPRPKHIDTYFCGLSNTSAVNLKIQLEISGSFFWVFHVTQQFQNLENVPLFSNKNKFPLISGRNSLSISENLIEVGPTVVPWRVPEQNHI
jgi:hypothetical protein